MKESLPMLSPEVQAVPIHLINGAAEVINFLPSSFLLSFCQVKAVFQGYTADMEREFQRRRDLTSDELLMAFVLSRLHKTHYPYYGEVAYRLGYLFPVIMVGAANMLVNTSGSLAKEATKAINS